MFCDITMETNSIPATQVENWRQKRIKIEKKKSQKTWEEKEQFKRIEDFFFLFWIQTNGDCRVLYALNRFFAREEGKKKE